MCVWMWTNEFCLESEKRALKLDLMSKLKNDWKNKEKQSIRPPEYKWKSLFNILLCFTIKKKQTKRSLFCQQFQMYGVWFSTFYCCLSFSFFDFVVLIFLLPLEQVNQNVVLAVDTRIHKQYSRICSSF